MANKRKHEGTVSTSATSSAKVAKVETVPAFWFGFEVAWAKLVLARVVLFALLATDALLQIRHAPRYGAGGFNVAHFGWLDHLGPGRVGYEVGQLILAYIFVLAACGVATRIALPIATAIYAWLYFGSQLDSYQHHYLVALILLLACFVPWQRPAGATPATPVRSWAVRLILVQLAIMYFWAAISKMNAAWLDGTTLGSQLEGPVEHLIHATIGMANASRLVMLTELGLAATLWWRRAWPYVAPIGILFHIGILASSLEIGLFAWLMLGFYILVVPDVVWTKLAAILPSWRPVVKTGWVVWLAAVVIGLVLVIASRFDHGLAVGLVLTAAFIAWSIVVRRRVHLAWVAAAHLLAFTAWTLVDRASNVVPDYYRFLGGSARRYGDPADAVHAYRRLLEIDPGDASAQRHLDEVLHRIPHPDDGD